MKDNFAATSFTLKKKIMKEAMKRMAMHHFEEFHLLTLYANHFCLERIGKDFQKAAREHYDMFEYWIAKAN